MRPELRLIEYFAAVKQAGTVTRAAEELHISQPSLSAAIRQLEAQLGVALLHRHGRRVTLTEAGELLAARGERLLRDADALVSDVRGLAAATTGRVKLGATPTARHGVLPRLLAACALTAPGVMLYTSENTTGALLRELARGTLDAAITFCAPAAPDGVVLHPLSGEPAVVHMRDDHPLAGRDRIQLTDLRSETILVAASRDSGGYTDRILAALRAAGIDPPTRPDPYPDLGLRAVREGLGVVIYVRGAFPPDLRGSTFVAVAPAPELPFHLATRNPPEGTALAAILAAAAPHPGDATCC